MILKGSGNMMRRVIWRCECGWPGHSIEFSWFPPRSDRKRPEDSEVYIYVTLTKLSFWNRFKIGLRYIFGLDYGFPFEESLVDVSSIKELISGLQECTDELKGNK